MSRASIRATHFGLAWSILALAYALCSFAADAPRADRAPIRCPGPTLARCTQMRAVSLRDLSRLLRQLSSQRPDSQLAAADVQQLSRFNQWLRTAADRADALAESGAKAVPQPSTGNSSQSLMSATQQMQEMQMSFNLQYLQLQQALQDESRQYAAASNLMKSRQDTVNGILANLK